MAKEYTSNLDCSCIPGFQELLDRHRTDHLAHSVSLLPPHSNEMDIAGTPLSLFLNSSFLTSLGTLLRTFVIFSDYLQTKLRLPRTSSSSIKGIMRPFKVIMAFAVMLFSLAVALPEPIPLAIPEAVPVDLPEATKE